MAHKQKELNRRLGNKFMYSRERPNNMSQSQPQ